MIHTVADSLILHDTLSWMLTQSAFMCPLSAACPGCSQSGSHRICCLCPLRIQVTRTIQGQGVFKTLGLFKGVALSS